MEATLFELSKIVIFTAVTSPTISMMFFDYLLIASMAIGNTGNSKMTEQEYTVRVLGMQCEDYIAIEAIDLDIWGYGESRPEAMQNLFEHLRVHIAYLKRANKVQLIHRPCNSEFLDMYDEYVLARITNRQIPGWWIAAISPAKILGDIVFEPVGVSAVSANARYLSSKCHQLAS